MVLKRHCFSTTLDRCSSSRLWTSVTVGREESIHCVQRQLGLSCKPDYHQPASGVFLAGPLIIVVQLYARRDSSYYNAVLII